ncbi:MAG: PD-(D/E)XK nuclease family protein [Rhodospirillales bacterium]
MALTRARDHLVVCGWQTRGQVPAESWYAAVERGMRGAAAAAVPHRWGTSLQLECPQGAEPDGSGRAGSSAAASLPAWAGTAPEWRPTPPPPEPPQRRPLAPSRPEDAALGPVPPARSPLLRAPAGPAAIARGELVHALLQHLPGLAPSEREAAAIRFARRATAPEAAEAPAAEALAAQVLALLEHPSLAPLFGPTSRPEQGLTGLVGDQIITGRVDRLAVLAHEVLVADYKTARTPPRDADAVPVRYLRQMSAYHAILSRIYPGRSVRCLLIYTEEPSIIEIPLPLLDRHAPRPET